MPALRPIPVLGALAIAVCAWALSTPAKVTVFLPSGWKLAPAGVSVPIGDMAAGGTLIVAGQMLNLGVFVQLGKIGVFYGNKLGYHVPRCEGFPFSLFHHPQYIGTVLSIWGFFMTTRFPHDDWYLLPILQTGHYVIGAYLES